MSVSLINFLEQELYPAILDRKDTVIIKAEPLYKIKLEIEDNFFNLQIVNGTDELIENIENFLRKKLNRFESQFIRFYSEISNLWGKESFIFKGPLEPLLKKHSSMLLLYDAKKDPSMSLADKVKTRVEMSPLKKSHSMISLMSKGLDFESSLSKGHYGISKH